MAETKPISIIVPVKVAAQMKALAKRRGLKLSALWEAAAIRHMMAGKEEERAAAASSPRG